MEYAAWRVLEWEKGGDSKEAFVSLLDQKVVEGTGKKV